MDSAAGKQTTERAAVPAPVIALIDEALERFGSRDLVAAAEVVDFLLDLRLSVEPASGVADAELTELLEQERAPAPS
jgi:hypothetical protein